MSELFTVILFSSSVELEVKLLLFKCTETGSRKIVACVAGAESSGREGPGTKGKIQRKLINYKEMIHHMKEHVRITSLAKLRTFGRKVTKLQVFKYNNLQQQQQKTLQTSLF